MLKNLIYKISAKSYFGVKSQKEFMTTGFGRLINLKAILKKHIDFADLGIVKTSDFASLNQRPRQIQELNEKHLATITLVDDGFRHSSSSDSLSTHTIGIVINKNANEYFYKTQPEILIIDSMGDSYPRAKNIHSELIDKFLSKQFPGSRFIVSKNIQQTPDSLTCLNWTLANLQVARKNLGRADLLNILPKKGQINSILNEQKRILENSK